jgi:hypothetical protein
MSMRTHSCSTYTPPLLDIFYLIQSSNMSFASYKTLLSKTDDQFFGEFAANNPSAKAY